MTKSTTVLSHAWHVAWGVLIVLVVLYVFARLGGRTEIIMVSVLGLVYGTLGAAAIGHGRALVEIALGLEQHLGRVLVLLNDPTIGSSEVPDELMRKINQTQTNGHIDLGCLFVVQLICLFNLFRAL
jgi:hypothetical protein